MNLTALAPAKLLPVIVTSVPTGPLAGVNDAIEGAGGGGGGGGAPSIISESGRFQTPKPVVPARSVDPSALSASEKTPVVSPVPTDVQLFPLSVERKTPPWPPAKRFVPSGLRSAVIRRSVRPLLTSVQVAPLFVER